MTENKLVPTVKADMLQTMDFLAFPHPHLMEIASIKEWTINKLLAGEVPPEYIGRHGVCGLAWPPLEYFDDNHATLHSTPWFKYRIENLKEYLLQEDDEVSDASAEEEAAMYHDARFGGSMPGSDKGDESADDDDDDDDDEDDRRRWV